MQFAPLVPGRQRAVVKVGQCWLRGRFVSSSTSSQLPVPQVNPPDISRNPHDVAALQLRFTIGGHLLTVAVLFVRIVRGREALLQAMEPEPFMYRPA